MKICDSEFLDNGSDIFRGYIMFKRICHGQYVKDSQLVNELGLFIYKEWGYQMKVLRRNIISDNDFSSEMPKQMTKNVQKFAAKLKNIKACQGIEKFDDILTEDNSDFSQLFVNEKGEVVKVKNEASLMSIRLGEFATFHANV